MPQWQQFKVTPALKYSGIGWGLALLASPGLPPSRSAPAGRARAGKDATAAGYCCMSVQFESPDCSLLRLPVPSFPPILSVRTRRPRL
eukprot:4337631-Pyramimonas_sp.AAC.1